MAFVLHLLREPKSLSLFGFNWLTSWSWLIMGLTGVLVILLAFFWASPWPIFVWLSSVLIHLGIELYAQGKYQDEMEGNIDD